MIDQDAVDFDTECFRTVSEENKDRLFKGPSGPPSLVASSTLIFSAGAAAPVRIEFCASSNHGFVTTEE